MPSVPALPTDVLPSLHRLQGPAAMCFLAALVVSLPVGFLLMVLRSISFSESLSDSVNVRTDFDHLAIAHVSLLAEYTVSSTSGSRHTA